MEDGSWHFTQDFGFKLELLAKFLVVNMILDLRIPNYQNKG